MEQPTLVVVPVRDGNGDRASAELAVALRDALRGQGALRVIDARTVDAIVQYHDAPKQSATSASDPTSRLIAEAKARYLKFDNRGALTIAKQAVAAAEQAVGTDAAAAQHLVDALLTLAMAHHAARDEAAMRAAMDLLARAAPMFVLDAANYPPSMATAFQSAKSVLARGGEASLKIESAPPMAAVQLNGMSVGTTPLALSHLPIGTYRVTIAANRYRPFTQQVTLQAGQTATVRGRLAWNRQPEGKDDAVAADVAGGDARAQIAEGVRIGELTRADKIVAVDVNESVQGDGGITVRCIDRALKAGQSPIVIRFDRTRRDLHANLARMTTLVARQVAIDPLRNPGKETAPIGEGDPVLLGRRRHSVSPAVMWSAVGAGVVGGLLATIFALRGNGPSTGAIQVSFK